jgi:UDP-GlcNAc:undecaprenyl-phosphate/decaprenyl-phosphate GlcNAc-1-phosphate transferase
MLDGLDGLAGSVALIALAGLMTCFLGTQQLYAAVVAQAFIGALAAFLIFNVPAKFNRPVLSFMGDAGSTLLGFAVAGVSLIAVQAGSTALPAVVVLWLMPIPIFELFFTTCRRLLKGVSPMQADRGHSHHRLLDAGLSVRTIFVLYLGVSSISAVSGLLLWKMGYADAVLFYTFAAVSTVWFTADNQCQARD